MSETQTPVELSDMEKIRMRSIDPAFIKECETAGRNIHDKNREREYTEGMLAARKALIDERDAARKGFEKFCRKYKSEDI